MDDQAIDSIVRDFRDRFVEEEPAESGEAGAEYISGEPGKVEAWLRATLAGLRITQAVRPGKYL